MALIVQNHDFNLPGPDEVHVWHFGLDLPPPRIVELEHLLASDEIARADCLHGQVLRSRFVAGRGTMRRILQRYVRSLPEAIAFTYGPHGKPFLTGHDSPIEFNLSHSEGRALLAVSQDPVGIDLEFVRINLDIEGIASTVFTHLEIAELRAVPERDRNRYFLKMWVRKEALMKVKGRGLLDSPTNYSVMADAAGLSFRMTNNTEKTIPWRVYDLAVGQECVAALAVAGTRSHRIMSFDLEAKVL